MIQLTETMLEDPRWAALGLEKIAEIACHAALEIAGVEAAGFEISVLGCDDARITALNAEFRSKPTPTNVLSWPAFDLATGPAGSLPAKPQTSHHAESIGDIAIASGVCQQEAADKNVSVKDHVTHLVLHGCLHLLGYDHENDADATVMEGLEIKALAKLGISDPY